MAKKKERIAARLAALDDDYNSYSARKSPPDKQRIAVAEKALKRRFPKDYREFLANWGTLALEVDAGIWPRPDEYEVRPGWQMEFGVVVHGVCEGVPPVLDVVLQAKALRKRWPKAKGFLPVMRRTLGADVYAYDAKDRLVLWRHDDVPDAAPGDLFETLLHEIDELVGRREQLRDEPIALADGASDTRHREVATLAVEAKPAQLLAGLKGYLRLLQTDFPDASVHASCADDAWDLSAAKTLPVRMRRDRESIWLFFVYGTSGPLDDDFEVFVYPAKADDRFTIYFRTLGHPAKDPIAKKGLASFLAALGKARAKVEIS